MVLQWHTTHIPLSRLRDYSHNPRRISKKEMDKLVASIKQDGYHQRIIVNHDYTIVGGHQRKQALLKAGYKDDDEIEVLAPNRPLTQEEIDRINIRDNLPFGEYDFDMLANRFDIEKLIGWGMEESQLVGFSEEDLNFDNEKVSKGIKTEGCQCNCCEH